MGYAITRDSELLSLAQRFIFKILEAGDKYYSPKENVKGTIKLTPEMTEMLTSDLIDKPIIIGHSKLTPDNIDHQAEIVVGRIIRTFTNVDGFTTSDGVHVVADNHTYAEGIIDKQTGIDYINKGYLPSIYYSILEERPIGKNKIEVISAVSNHLGLVNYPKYDTSVYNYNFNNKQMQLMTKNATGIANGTYVNESEGQETAEVTAVANEVVESTPLDNLYYKDEEGNEYLIADMWEAVKGDMENEATKEYYSEPEITIEGKSYNVANMCSKYKDAQVANSDTEASKGEEGKLPTDEKSKDAANDKAGVSDVANGSEVCVVANGDTENKGLVSTIATAVKNIVSGADKNITIYTARAGTIKPKTK